MEMINKSSKKFRTDCDGKTTGEMQMRRAVKNARFLSKMGFVACFLVFGGCAIFGGGDDEPVKNVKIHFTAPPSPFEEVNVTSADHVWQSKKTGSTIALNSACLEKNREDLPSLEKGILSGVEHLKLVSETKLSVYNAPAERVRAEGRSDGIPISIDLVTVKKTNCTYDLAYVAKTDLFDSEKDYFDKFIEKVQLP
jgi:hypothetical protein